MSDVSCKATRILLEAVAREGVAPARVVAGLPVTLETLRDSRQMISWDLFMAIHERVEKLFPSPEALGRIPVQFVHFPEYRLIRGLAAGFVGASRIHVICARWILPPLFPGLRASAERLDGGRVLLTVEIPSGWRDGRPFFRFMQHAVAQVTLLLDAPPSVVEAEIGTHRAVYCIRLPPARRSVLASLAALPRALRSLSEILGLLAAQHQDLVDSHQAVLVTRQEYRELLERVPDMVLIHREGKVVWANEAAVRLLGRDDLPGLFGAELLDLVHPLDLEPAAERLRMPPEARATQELRALRPDGDARIVELTAPRPVTFEGRPAMLVVGRDVTDRRRMQERLLLTDRMASLGVLSASIAHEINNPLTYAQSSLELAQRQLAELPADGAAREPVDRLTELVCTAAHGVQRAGDIALNLKAFSRAAGEERGSADINAVLRQTIDLAGAELRQRARLVLELRDVPPVEGAAARLGQVFLNLLINAAASLPAGPPPRGEIVVRSDVAPDGMVEVSVADSGAGMSPEVLARAFDPFFTTKPAGSGTGLGLAICHDIVGRVGGSIRAVSAPGAGTTITVRLRAGEATLDREPAPAAAPHIGGGRVLVVDDERPIADVVRAVLADHYEVEIATSGAEALARLGGGRAFDAVVCDLMMPNVSGMEVYRRLTAAGSGMERRVLFMTGGAFSADARNFLAAVDNPCLEKPFQADQLTAAVDAVIRGQARTGLERG